MARHAARPASGGGRETTTASFPPVELSYEKHLHRKVPADVYSVLPKGKRAFLWFAREGRKNVARIVTANQRGRALDSVPVVLAFNDRLAAGTVLSGTRFRSGGSTYFCADDVLWDGGVNCSRRSVADRLLLLARVMSSIGRSRHASIVVGTPVMAETYDEASRAADTLPYEVRGVQARRTRGQGSIVGVYPPPAAQHRRDQGRGDQGRGDQGRKDAERTEVFEVEAMIECDIYQLKCLDGGELVSHGVAAVTTYDDSVAMNRIFRRIRENDNLDLLEESDDEETFENVRADKYVISNNRVLMECVYVPRFGRWRPVRQAPLSAHPATKATIERAEKK